MEKYVKGYIEDSLDMAAETAKNESKLQFLNKTAATVPDLHGLIFPPKSRNATVHKVYNNQKENLSIILPSVACFCLGITLAAVAGYVFYRRQKVRWNEQSAGNEDEVVTSDNPKFTIFQNNPLGEFFLYKEGVVSEDTQSALNFLATPFVYESKLNDGFDAREQALLEIQNEIDKETKGESNTDSIEVGTDDLLKDAVPSHQDVIWSVPDSDVRVTIPKASLPKTRGQSSIKVALGANPLNVTSKNNEVQLTPLLILSSPNIIKYNKPVELRLPHRANLYSENNWNIQLRYSGTAENNINKLHWKDAVKDMNNDTFGNDVSYRYDNEFIYLKTHFPGLFCAVGTGTRKKRPLNVAAIAFAYPLPPQTCEPEPGQEVVKTGVDIKVFVIDSFREAIQHLTNTEVEAGGMSISQPMPIRMVNEKNWQVNLVSADWPQWAYSLHENQRLKTTPSEKLYKLLGTGTFVEFRIFTKPNTENQSETFEATFSVSQQRKKKANVISSRLKTRPFPLPKSNSSMGSDCQVRMLDFPDPFSGDENNLIYS